VNKSGWTLIGAGSNFPIADYPTTLVRVVTFKRSGPSERAFYFFFFPEPIDGCQPDVAPFWLAAAAIVLTFSFLGFLASRLPFCSGHAALRLVVDK
jgi:hypothetical protein